MEASECGMRPANVGWRLADVGKEVDRIIRNSVLGLNMRLQDQNILSSIADLGTLPQGKLLINTINAWSFVVAQKDEAFAEALQGGDVLIPDGKSIVLACRFLKTTPQPKERIAGWDLFCHEMKRVSSRVQEFKGSNKGKVMFLGSSEKTLALIRQRAAVDYPELEIVTYSPPFKAEFSTEDNAAMIKTVNDANPDLLWIGMTAPKQEKWTYEHWNELNIHCHVGTIGAVFDFYAGTIQRAPQWMQKSGLEWFHRLMSNPKRMWRRYLIGNFKFLYYIIKEL